MKVICINGWTDQEGDHYEVIYSLGVQRFKLGIFPSYIEASNAVKAFEREHLIS